MSISSGSKILASDVNSHINNTSNPHAVTASQIGAMVGSNSLAAGTDFNTVTNSGIYRFSNDNINGPGCDWGQLLVMHGGGDTITQIVGDYASGALYTRSGNPSDVGGSGSWTSWNRLATVADLPKKQNITVSYNLDEYGRSGRTSWTTRQTYTFDFVPDEIEIYVSNITRWYYNYNSSYSGTLNWSNGNTYRIVQGGYFEPITGDSRNYYIRWYLTGKTLLIQTKIVASSGADFYTSFDGVITGKTN